MATRTDTQSPALHVAERHDLIRVHGGRDHLKDVSAEIPKRRLTVFTRSLAEPYGRLATGVHRAQFEL